MVASLPTTLGYSASLPFLVATLLEKRAKPCGPWLVATRTAVIASRARSAFTACTPFTVTCNLGASLACDALTKKCILFRLQRVLQQ